jgi:5-bromo-4-chloroindolyl phosphate hydrolysis protein
MSESLQHTPPVEDHLDDWHQHTAAEGRPQAEHAANVNIAMLGFVGFVIVAVVVAMVVLVVIYFQAYSSTLIAQKAENTVWYEQEYRPYAASSQRRLQEFGWIDAEAGVIRVPIDHAFSRVIESHRDSGR